MTEVVFPVLGTAFIVLFLLPACALIARGALLVLSRFEARGPLHGLGLRYLILTASSILPLSWLFSAALHQAESGQSLIVCLFDHETAALCFEPTLFVAALLLTCSALAFKDVRAARRVAIAGSERAHSVRARIAALIASREALHCLQGRVHASERTEHALVTEGLLLRRVVVDAAYAEACSDEELAEALSHEAEHVRGFDPLRYLVLAVALAVNPFGRFLLERDAQTWLAAREAHCDREAVIRGAEPLALAEALVRAARPQARPPVAALGAGDASLLKLRIDMLFAFHEQRPTRCCNRERSSASSVLVLVLLAAVLPHQTSTAALDLLHVGTEQLLHLFWN